MQVCLEIHTVCGMPCVISDWSQVMIHKLLSGMLSSACCLHMCPSGALQAGRQCVDFSFGVYAMQATCISPSMFQLLHRLCISG